MASELIRGHLDVLVLSVIEGGARHGYAITEKLRLLSGGVFDPPEGTLYPALYRLENEGLLRSDWTIVDGRRRRVYKLTPRGRRELVVKKKEWASFRNAMAGVIGSTVPEPSA
jgi:PadR family transcriptional regulator, regulatory protein PadR